MDYLIVNDSNWTSLLNFFHIPSLEVRRTFFNVESIVVPVENKLFEIHFSLFYLIHLDIP